MGFRGNIAAQDKVSNTLFVDATYGDDNTGERENKLFPYQTIQAAVNDAVDGDEIVVSGSFTTVAEILVNNKRVRFNFLKGSSIECTAPVNMFRTLGGGGFIEIHGRGEFYNSNATPTGAVRVFNAACEIFGAREIRSENGALVGGGWLNIRNVDFMWSTGQTIYVFNNPAHDGVTGGVIENVNIGSRDTPITVGISASTVGATDQQLVLKNVNVVGESVIGTACLQSSTGAENLTWKAFNCQFIALDRQRVTTFGVNGRFEFTDCYFEQNADLAGITITTGQTWKFTDCRIKGNGTQVLIFNNNSTGKCYFFGINQIENVLGSVTMSGQLDRNYDNYGTLLMNKPTQSAATQYWDFTGIAEPPTVGDVFTITANDGETASYTVQLGDTEFDVWTGLSNAIAVKAAELPENDFANWSVQIFGVSPYTMRLRTVDPDDNYDIAEGESWTFSTTGGDPINTPVSANNGGVAINGGQVIVDENLIVN